MLMYPATASLRVAFSSTVSRTERARGFPEFFLPLFADGRSAFKLDMVEVLRIEVLSAIGVDLSYEGDMSKVYEACAAKWIDVGWNGFGSE